MKFQSEVAHHHVEISKSVIKNWVDRPKTCKEATKGLQVWILRGNL